MNAIDRLRGDFAFLSNFYPCRIKYEGAVYGSAEAAFQAAKCEREADRTRFTGLTAKQARQTGRNVPLRADWEQCKLGVLRDIIAIKFRDNPDLGEALLETGTAEIVEGNTWHDNYWGNCECAACKSVEGQNHLGRLLMECRMALKREAEYRKTIYTVYVDRADDYESIDYVYPESFFDLDRAREVMQSLIDEANNSLNMRYDVEKRDGDCWQRFPDGEYNSDHIQIKILTSYLTLLPEETTNMQG